MLTTFYKDIFNAPLFYNLETTYGFNDRVVKTENGSYKVTLEVPGYGSEDVEVSVKDSTLTVNLKQGDKKRKVSYRLGRDVKQENITATCKNGLLTILCPVDRETNVKSIRVTSD